ncbi:GNAT family N-acetyltransferase [Virgibacillus sp. MSJ-26]|uniref:GNAT family N-acetyltransferase n=1 Tax=Virgibacillus sp. MSJ-26 TaxID=2841522 RepID=UPI001C127103|nr:GNAT family N-acetyltransferase [Virgibacillus sp. MSJ-26]MBU5468571.1 GNAT family N-acetyltransferase [Virgibacillus sp. MSJ-26]
MTHPILKDFPNEFVTSRLLVRLPLPGDGEQVYKAITRSKEELKPWLPFARNEQAVEETEINVRESYVAFLKREDLRLHIFDKETNEFIGCTGLHRIDWNVPKFEIGYWIDTKFSGQGLISEAVEGVTNFAFEELGAKRVEIRCDFKNVKSKAVPERLGYTLEAILKNDDVSLEGDELRDTCIYAKVDNKE